VALAGSGRLWRWQRARGDVRSGKDRRGTWGAPREEGRDGAWRDWREGKERKGGRIGREGRKDRKGREEG
jgi:hypothetical protein